MRHFSPVAEVAGGDQGGGMRPSDGGSACSVLAWGGRRRSSGPAGCWGRLGLKLKKILSE
jgi:hypothetical protein